MDIKRDASDKHKGVKLQKLRAIKLGLDTIISNPKAQFHLAIESDGDVFIYSGNRKFIEENKNYDSKNFSFFSKQILNTLVYFLDYWLKDTVNKSSNIVFSFYSTNSISKEYNTDRIKSLGIEELPSAPILSLLMSKEWNNENKIIDICRKIILSEYEEQYKGKNNHYFEIEKFTDEDWVKFFSQIIWNFGMPNNGDLRDELKESIGRYGELKNINVKGKELFIEAMLRQSLEDKQDETDIIHRYLTDESLELICYKIINQPIDKNLYRHIDYDYTGFVENINIFTSSFLEDKYFSISYKKSFPSFLQRKVKKHSPEIKIETSHLQETDPNNLIKDVIVEDINSFIDDLKPTFLFGEIGSGKSSIVAQYAIEENKAGNLCILIPANSVKGSINVDFQTLFKCVNSFVNNNVSNKEPYFDFEFILYNRPITLVFDGIDELTGQEARYLLKHLEKINRDYSDLKIIATGRPVELQSIVRFNDWNCLTTIDLTELEVLNVLINEAIVEGLSTDEAAKDSAKRMEFLKSRSELSLLAKTPLVVCLLRDFLVENLEEETLGTLMYKILLKRLKWDEIDLKTIYSNFFEEFPQEFQREKIISIIAEEIFNSDNKNIGEIKLSQIITDNIQNTDKKNQIVAEATLFYKNLFLQLNDKNYSFVSQPLLEIAYGVRLSESINTNSFSLDINDNTWRPFSFAISINRLKGHISEATKKVILETLDTLLIYESNIPIAAIIVTESKDSDLAMHFISKMDTLDFRPIRTWSNNIFWGEPDSYSPYTIAETINLAGDLGLNWFFEEYLNPKHPLLHIESQVKAILGNLLFIKHFELEENYKEKLLEFAKYHLEVRTLCCVYIVPIVSLIAPQEIELEKRCIMFLQLLPLRLYNRKCKELLDSEIQQGNKNQIINAIEIIVSKDGNKNDEVLNLWLDLKDISQEELNQTILDEIIKRIAEGNELLYKRLTNKHLNEVNFLNYLRYCTLNNTRTSKYAAIILYSKFNERNLYLIARPLITKSKYFTDRNKIEITILDDLLKESPKKSFDFLSSCIPHRTIKGREAVIEAYIYYSNRVLNLCDGIFKNDFFYTINHLPDYPILVRYPEIRNSYKELLTSKPQYREYLIEASQHIDFRLRSNANSILLACFPENSNIELENIIYSAASKSTDNIEWLRFCMKLNYSENTLSYIKSKLEDFPELSRVFALIILYHQGVVLSYEEVDYLANGLLGDGYFFDSGDVFNPQNDLKRLVQQPEFYSKFIEVLNSGDLSKAKRAASILISYHYEKLSKKELGKAYVYECEYWERSVYDFDKYRKKLFEDLDFLDGFNEANKILEESKIEGSLSLYKKVVIDGKNEWLKFIKQLTYSERFFDNHKLELFYFWLLGLRKKNSGIIGKIGDEVIEFLSYPAIEENNGFNRHYAYYGLIASEFSGKEIDLENVLLNYKCTDDLQVSFLSRLGYVPENFMREDSKQYFELFSSNTTTTISKIEQNQIEKLFLGGEVIPKITPNYIESILLFDIYSIQELTDISEKGGLASIISSLVLFCKNKNIDFKVILNAINKTGWYFYRDSLKSTFSQALFIIKEEMIKSDDSKELFAEELKKSIIENQNERSNSIIENFEELFSLNVDIEIQHLKILFDEILQTPYRLKLSLIASIFHYTITNLAEEDYGEVSIEIEKNTKGLINYNPLKGFDEDVIPILWMFSLISLYIDKEVRDYSSIAFFKGLETIFITKSDRYYTNRNNEKVRINGRELLLYSNNIYQRIPSHIFQELIANGAKSASPEIKNLCLLLKGFVKL